MGSARRRLAILLVLSGAVVQPALRSPLFASALSLGHGHAHSLVLAADAGHFDLVLSHAHEPGGPQAGAPDAPAHAGHGISCSAHDHVVHLADDLAAREMSRKDVSRAALPLAAPAVFPLPRALAAGARPAWPPAHVDLLRTVVLRA